MTSAGPPLTRHIVLLQALHAAPERAAALTAGLPPAGLDWRPEPAAWNCRETLAHLAAAEPPFYQRLQSILAADNPWLPRFGPETARPETAEALPALLAQFEAGRRQLLRFLSELPAADWDRPAVHETMGPTTLLAQVQNIVNHDADHLSQLESVCQRWAARPPA
ncbi:MAG: DinB family protein [Anaerolineales bacterium]|nr:DinB family protein [Anaerolineales bacterium]